MLSALQRQQFLFKLILRFIVSNLHLGPGASDKPCSTVYQGASAMSEIEVQNVDRFLKSEKKRLAGFLDVHNYSQMWMIPWGYTKENIKDYDELVSNNKLLLIFVEYRMARNFLWLFR